jgi:two-component system chemotaxis response regulator CheY
MHVLICDDDTATRFVAKRLIGQRDGFTTDECTNGAEALAMLNHGGVDLLLLDVGMPVVDGVEVLTQIRATTKLAQLPVIMLSRENRRDVVLKLLRLGVSAYILKPLDAEKMSAALERVALPAAS